MGASGKRKKDQPSSSSGKKQKTSTPRGFQELGRSYQGQGQTKASNQSGPLTCETRFPAKVGIQGIRDTSILVISGTSADAVYSFSPQCGPNGPVSVSGCCTSTFCYTDKP